MKKLKLKALELGARELLSREQLRNVFGGSDGSEEEPSEPGGSDDCEGTKQSSCEGKDEGDFCCFKWEGNVYDGHCAKFAPSYIMHCSDLN